MSGASFFQLVPRVFSQDVPCQIMVKFDTLLLRIIRIDRFSSYGLVVALFSSKVSSYFAVLSFVALVAFCNCILALGTWLYINLCKFLKSQKWFCHSICAPQARACLQIFDSAPISPPHPSFVVLREHSVQEAMLIFGPSLNNQSIV